MKNDVVKKKKKRNNKQMTLNFKSTKSVLLSNADFAFINKLYLECFQNFFSKHFKIVLFA